MANYDNDNAMSFSTEPSSISDDSSDSSPTSLFTISNQSVIIIRESSAAVNSTVLEISPGLDIIESIINFAHRFRVGISVISAVGSVCNVALCDPIFQYPLSLSGPFNLFSLSGSFLGALAGNSNSVASFFAANSLHALPSFSISLIGPQGQMFGGIVAGKVIAISSVMVVLTTHSTPTFYRVPEWTGDQWTGPSMVHFGAIGGIGSNVPMSVPPYCPTNNPTPMNHSVPPTECMYWAPPVPPY